MFDQMFMKKRTHDTFKTNDDVLKCNKRVLLDSAWLLEESKHHGASERPGKPLRAKSARTNTSSNAE